MLRAGQFGTKTVVEGKGGAVVTSEANAAAAALDVLQRGGNAVDAALTAAATQLVTEPHMTSITGGMALLYRDHKSGHSEYLSANINAPLAELHGFSGADLSGARGVPVPGWWPGLLSALGRFGTIPLAEVLAPAIEAAREGFEVSPYLFGEMYRARDVLGSHTEARAMYLPNGSLLAPGQCLRQEAMAQTLERLRDEGNDYYLGGFTDEFVRALLPGGGVISREDFESYSPEWMAPISAKYRGLDFIGSSPPEDGGLQLAEAFQMLETIDLRRFGPSSVSPETLINLAAIHNEVYYSAPRTQEAVADPGVLSTLLSNEYARSRQRLLGLPAVSTSPTASPGTIHVSVVDRNLNVASLTHSHMASGWVNPYFVGGFQHSGGGSFFQRVMPQPGTRATIYLAPNMLLKDGVPVIVSGSPSVSLVACVLQNLVNIVDFEMPIEEAVRQPRFGVKPHDPAVGWTPGTTLESGFDDSVVETFEKWASRRRLWTKRIGPWNSMTGNFEGITIDAQTGLMRSCADPRRVGAAMALA